MKYVGNCSYVSLTFRGKNPYIACRALIFLFLNFREALTLWALYYALPQTNLKKDGKKKTKAKNIPLSLFKKSKLSGRGCLVAQQANPRLRPFLFISEGGWFKVSVNNQNFFFNIIVLLYFFTLYQPFSDIIKKCLILIGKF